ncbi:response regulator transcription factor [Candidatus Gracilibacteria bacterium]|nr:response regulator transcription factor [Candidatus Gracilibacteria bacterium]
MHIHNNETPLVLLVEDDAALAAPIKVGIEGEAWRLLVASSCAKAPTMLEIHQPDLLLLVAAADPQACVELCQRVRSGLDNQVPAVAATPTLVVFGTPDVQQRLAAFRAGVDDCWSAVFGLEELVCRMQVQLRRKMGTAVAGVARGIASRDSIRGCDHDSQKPLVIGDLARRWRNVACLV